MNDLYLKTYLSIIDENKKLNPDELLKENLTTIAEQPENNLISDEELKNSENLNNNKEENFNDDEESEINNEFEKDGWESALGEQYDSILDLSEKLEDFTYEIKNCQRGSFTNANSKEELADYMVSLAEELNSYAENLRG